MVKRVPADIADTVYSGPVRGYAPKLWNLAEALHFRVHKIGPGDLGIRLQLGKIAISNNVGGVKHDLSTRLHALVKERHFALVDGLRFPTLGSL